MLRANINKIKKYSEVLAWYTGNEPHLSKVNPKTMKQIDNIIREEDPYHPTLVVNYYIEHILNYADSTAVCWADPYPEFVKNGGWVRPQFTTIAVEASVTASKGRKPVWVILQAHNTTLFGKKNHRAPNFVDLRNQMYQAAIAGAKGFFWYCRYWMEPHVKIGLTYLAAESKLLSKAILAPKSHNKFITVKKNGKREPDMHLSRRETTNDLYLFAASSSNKKRKITFNAENLKCKELFVIGENRKINLKRGMFSDLFEPYSTHIYTTNMSIANKLNIASVLKKIETTCNPVIKAGNFAVKSGTKIKVSCHYTNKFPL